MGNAQWLTNAPATFQRVMTHILQPHVNSFVLVYRDDSLVFSRTKTVSPYQMTGYALKPPTQLPRERVLLGYAMGVVAKDTPS